MAVALMRDGQARRRHIAEPQGDPQAPPGDRAGGARAGLRLQGPQEVDAAATRSRASRGGSSTAPTAGVICSRTTSSSSPARRGSSRVRTSRASSTRSSWTRRVRCRSPTRWRSGSVARNLVFLGDPNQLPQVSQGAQQEEAKVSVSQHLLGEHETVPPERGIFLEHTWRLRPEICAFTSEAYYEGRSAARRGERSAHTCGRGRARPRSAASTRGAASPRGRRRTRSRRRSARCSGRRSPTTSVVTRPLGPDDFLVVAPYNAQVRRSSQRVPDGVRVGTVDKFQGQEAPVVLISMASSTAEDAPRGIGFAFNRHRVQRRDVACAVPRRARLRSAPPRRRLQDGRGDAARERGLPLRRAGRHGVSRGLGAGDLPA